MNDKIIRQTIRHLSVIVNVNKLDFNDVYMIHSP